MSLSTRRAAKEFELTHFVRLKGEIHKAAGFEIPIDVDWESLASPDREALYSEHWPQIYFNPLIEALKAVAIDDMGKQALQAALKKVIIKDASETHAGGKIAKFDKATGVLTLDNVSYSNLSDTRQRITSIQKALEDNL